MRIVLFGVGATGARAARQLGASDRVKQIEIRDPHTDQRDRVVRSLGPVAVAVRGRRLEDTVDVAVVATPSGSQVALARRCVRAGIPVVTTSDDIGEVRRLLALHADARDAGVAVVVGAGFMPGVSCLLARHAASELDEVDEIHVAKMGTGGPICARQHHRALSSTAIDWRDGAWARRPGGSGRELAWFPDPIDGHDCYRAALPDALLLAPAFPGVERVTARMAATRRDRLTAPLPMLRRPHPEGREGAIRVEVRGRVGIEQRIVVLGVAERPGVAAGAMAAVAALHAADGGFAAGAGGLATREDPRALLRALVARGVRPARFEGVPTFS
jgi:saccharopine dehydrogenase-like NADP-dependent oxidoreductase